MDRADSAFPGRKAASWALALLGAMAMFSLSGPAHAEVGGMDPGSGPTYADLADLIDPADMVIKAAIRRQTPVSAERAPGLAPGKTRLYVEARVTALLAGQTAIGESLRYLVDVPVDTRGRTPRLKGTDVILFARAVTGRPGEIQLVGPDAQMLASDRLEQRLRPMLADFFAPDAPAPLIRIRDVSWVPGNLAGESEMQMFVTTTGEGPALVSVIRRPGQAPAWGVSWSELADQQLQPPPRGSLVWYRLACFLPERLPADSHLSTDPVARDRAGQDYRFVLRSLGDCPRTQR